ncbi:Phosphoglycerate kinase [Spraguea lophii 42_110]|uniref:Phosphoglycerate kinase n=1 Tax=Spraguea lophii (strain 42_110) TaxID=1358809 RepID=S7WAI1_SPRLO|nr:Phosphoglycerate kinase [Spraguea lophii 42_110]
MIKSKNNYLQKKSIEDIDLNEQRIFYRVDYNVPMENNKVMEGFRIDSTLDTIRYMLNKRCKYIIIGSHLGRPKNREECSLKPLVSYLENKLKEKLIFTDINKNIENGKIFLMENLRYYDEEKNFIKNTALYKWIEKNADICVMDGFGVAHRWSGSVNGIKLNVYAGLLMKKEISMTSCLNNSDLIILGGKKVKDKLPLIKSLINYTKNIYFTGAMCFTLIKYKYKENIGKNYCEGEDVVYEIYSEAKKHNCKIFLPLDFISTEPYAIIKRNCIKDEICVDIGPETIEDLKLLVEKSNIIFWNGPPGIFEENNSSKGTEELIKMLEGKDVLIGGGDTLAAVNKFNGKFQKLSTGGGALLTMIEGGDMPGIDVIQNK